jgi:hypothetical protein
MTEVPLERSATQASDSPLLPSGVGQTISERFAGFGFGRQGEKKAAERGWKISRPMESLPSEWAGVGIGGRFGDARR